MFDYFNHFASKGNHPDKLDILALEEMLVFHSIDDINTDTIIKKATVLAKEKYNRPIGIRIYIQNKETVEYLMDSIKNDWLIRKENVCLKTGHSSYYIFLDNIETHQHDSLVNDEKYGVCGGSFPFIVNHEVIGALTCTGLRPHEDHDVIIEVLKCLKGGNENE